MKNFKIMIRANCTTCIETENESDDWLADAITIFSDEREDIVYSATCRYHGDSGIFLDSVTDHPER